MQRHNRILLLFATAMLLFVIGCGSGSKESKGIPPQYEDQGEIGSSIPPFVEMSHPDAPSTFVKDVSSAVEAGTWRWTGEYPTLRVRIPDTRNWQLRVRYAVSDATFKKTGPVKITYAVNGKDLQTEVVKTSGDREFNQPVPDTILKQGENVIAIHVHNPWTSPTDGAKLGIILTGAGLVRQ